MHEMRLSVNRQMLFASFFCLVSSTLDSQNNCADDFDNTVLMQTTHALIRDRDLEPNHEHDQVNTERVELHRDASLGKHANSKSIMETTVQSMATTIGALEHKIHQDPSGSWDEQATTLSSFQTMIVNQLQVFLDNEHEQDQAEFISRRQQHSGCSGDQRWEPGGDVATAAAELAIWRAKHQSCRSSERAWLTYKTTAISPPSCASESDISDSHVVLAAHVTLAALVGAAQTQAQAYDLTDPAGTRECPLDQTQFEDHFCAWRAAHFYACAASQDCIAQTGLSALRNELLIRSDNRRSLWRTLEILLCRVGHLLSSMDGDVATEVSDFNTTDNCSDILEDSTKFILDLTIPTLPVCDDHIAVGSTTSILMAPSMVDAAMCTQFREANYGAAHGWNQAQHVIPSECQTTCPAISYSSWVVPAACSNEPEDCRFYNHHRDACGSYDTASFVASDACCACGGGALSGMPCSIEVETSSQEHAETSTGANVQFLVGGIWSTPRTLGTDIAKDAVVSATERVQSRPTAVRLVAGGSNAWGFRRVAVSYNGEHFALVDTVNGEVYDGSQSDRRFWVDGDQAAPSMQRFEIPIKENWNCGGSGSGTCASSHTGLTTPAQCREACYSDGFDIAAFWTNDRNICRCYVNCDGGGPTGMPSHPNVVMQTSD